MSKPKPRASAPARQAEKQPSTPKFYDGPTVSNLDKSRRKSSPAGSAPLATKSDALVTQPAKQPVTVSVTSTTRKPKPRRKGWTLWGIITVLPLLLFASLWSVVLCPPPSDQPSSISQFALGTLGLKVRPEESSLHKTLCYPANVYHREVLVPYVYPAIEDVKAKVSSSSLYRDTLEPGYNAASSHAQRIWNGPLKPVVDRTARGANKLHRAYVMPHVPYVKAKFTEATAPLRLRMCAMYKEHLAPHVHVAKHHACAAAKQMRATYDQIMGHPATAQAGKHAHSAYLFGKHHGGRAYEYSKPHAIWAYNEGRRHTRDTILPRTRQALNAAGKQLCATYSVLKAHAAKMYNEHLAERLDPYVAKVNAAVAPYCKMFNQHVYRPYLQPVVHHFFPPQQSKGFWSYLSDFVPAAGSTVGNRDSGKKIVEDVKADAKKATDAAAKKAAEVKKQAEAKADEAKVAAEKKQAEAKAAAEKKKAEAKATSLKKEAESKTREAERAAKTAAQGVKKQAEDITAAGESKVREAGSAAETVAQEAKRAAETVVQDGKQKVFNAEQTASAAGTAATDAAKKAVSAGATTAYEAVKGATESAKSAADKASASAESAAKAASKGAESAATSASKGAESAADAALDTKADVHAKIALLKKKIDFQGKALYSRVQSDTLKNAEHFFTLTKDIQRIGEDNLKREIDRMIQGLDRLYSNSRSLTWEQLEESQSMSDTKVIKILDQVKKGVKVKMNHVYEQSKPAVEKAQQDIEAVLGDEYTKLGERMRGIEGINRKDWDAYKALKRDVDAWKTKLAEAPEKPATRELKQALQRVHTEGNDIILYFGENYEEWKDRQAALRRQAAERIQAREALEAEGKQAQIPRAQPKKVNDAKKQAILNQEVPVKAAFITKEPGEQVKTHHAQPTEKAKAKQQDNE